MSTALDQMLVLDLTQFESGPSCTAFLAFLGAEVIKIEHPARGDIGRALAADRPGEDGDNFMRLNANKKSLTLNLKSPRGRELFCKMVVQADVVVENFSPGVMERLGLGYEVLQEVNPMIIYATVTGFGTYAPDREDKSFDLIAQATAGVCSATGAAEEPSLKPGPTLGDTGSGIHTAAGILAAYIDRMTHGHGQKVEDSRQDSVDVEHPEAGKFALPVCPVQLSESPVEVKPAPLLGEHNAEIYNKLLGLTAADLHTLRQTGDI